MLSKLRYAICLMVYWHAIRWFFPLIIICAKLRLILLQNITYKVINFLYIKLKTEIWVQYINKKFHCENRFSITSFIIHFSSIVKRISIILHRINECFVFFVCLFVCFLYSNEEINGIPWMIDLTYFTKSRLRKNLEN